MTRDVLSFAGLLAVVLCAGACDGATTVAEEEMASLEPVEGGVWDSVADMRVFFAHQSVGANIVQGVVDLGADERGHVLTVTRAADELAIVGPGIYETPVGRNGDGRSKIDHFARLLDSGIGSKVDVAFMKLCYVDIDEHTDVSALFDHYRTTLDGLAERHPGVKFLHVTTPLQGPPPGFVTGLKQIVKRMMGRGGKGAARNAARETYNDLMRGAYGGRGTLFDLAWIESTSPRGTATTLPYDGRRVRCLAAEYTDDGGHLNARGRRVVARKLILALAQSAS